MSVTDEHGQEVDLSQEQEQQGLQYEGGDGFTVDLTDVEADKGFPVLPAGLYPSTVEECEYKLSNAAGKPMWAIKLAVDDDESKDLVNRKLFLNVSWAENMIARGKSFLMKVAPELIVTNFNPKTVADEGLLLGKPLRAKVGIRLYQGERRNEVKDVLAPLQGAATGGFSNPGVL